MNESLSTWIVDIAGLEFWFYPVEHRRKPVMISGLLQLNQFIIGSYSDKQIIRILCCILFHSLICSALIHSSFRIRVFAKLLNCVNFLGRSLHVANH